MRLNGLVKYIKSYNKVNHTEQFQLKMKLIFKRNTMIKLDSIQISLLFPTYTMWGNNKCTKIIPNNYNKLMLPHKVPQNLTHSLLLLLQSYQHILNMVTQALLLLLQSYQHILNLDQLLKLNSMWLHNQAYLYLINHLASN